MISSGLTLAGLQGGIWYDGLPVTFGLVDQWITSGSACELHSCAGVHAHYAQKRRLNVVWLHHDCRDCGDERLHGGDERPLHDGSQRCDDVQMPDVAWP